MGRPDVRRKDRRDERSETRYIIGRLSPPFLEGITEERVQLQPSPQPLPLAESFDLQHNTASSQLDSASEPENLELTRTERPKRSKDMKRHECLQCHKVCVRV